MSNNLWFARDDSSASAPSLPVTEVDPIHGVDPSLAADFTIDASSPAAGAGMTYAGLHGDMSGACYASPPSLGAYEVN